MTIWCHIHTGNDKSFKFFCVALRRCATLPVDTIRWVLTSEVSVRAYGSLRTLRRAQSGIMGVWNSAPVLRISQQDFSALWSGIVSVSCYKLLFSLVYPAGLQSLCITASWPQRPSLLFELYMFAEVSRGMFTCCRSWESRLILNLSRSLVAHCTI